MSRSWALVADADLAWRVFDDGCVVHHALSNDTHVLAAWIASLLQALSRPGPHDSDQLCLHTGLEPERVAQALQTLSDLRLIRPC